MYKFRFARQEIKNPPEPGGLHLGRWTAMEGWMHASRDLCSFHLPRKVPRLQVGDVEVNLKVFSYIPISPYLLFQLL